MESVLFEAKKQTHGDFVTKRIAPSKGILNIDSSDYSCCAHYLVRQLTERWELNSCFMIKESVYV